MELVQFYSKILTNYNYYQSISFYSIFSYAIFNFALLDTDSGGKINLDPDPQPWN